MKKPLLGTIADTVIGLALVAWVGGHAALGAYAARIIFRDADRAVASTTMTTVFREFDTLIEIALIFVVMATVLRAIAFGWETRADRIVVGACAALVALGAFEVTWVHPQIEGMFRAGRTLEPAFGQLHRLSARCANVEILLTGIIFAAQAASRRRAT